MAFSTERMGPDSLTIPAGDVGSTLGFVNASSDQLEDTALRAGQNPRTIYLKHPLECLPPLISHSFFVPRVMIEHLLRNKKNSALGVKFVSGNMPPDAITNMEAAMHTYVTPILRVKCHGDYRFRAGHGMQRYTNEEGFQLARQVILSAAIQPDFEDDQVMLALAALGDKEILGRVLPHDFHVLDLASKQDRNKRALYDRKIRSHIIASLVPGSRLPPLKDVLPRVKTVEDCSTYMDIAITAPESPETGIFVLLPGGQVVSLEMLCNSAFEQARNEILALERLCLQGYIYTSDPPSIFAREIGAKLLTRIQIFALKRLSSAENLENMKIFAFNDYADEQAIPLLQKALKTQNIIVMPKNELFSGPDGAYSPQPGVEKALLVIHNNSDAFGQNIETEHEQGSLDGAIGANSSAAASLLRDRKDLTTYLLAF